MQPALGHQGQQSDCLETDGFSAGVRSGDGNAGIRQGKLQAERNAGLRVQQRMPGVRQADAALRCDLCRTGVHLQAEFPTGKEHVQFRQYADGGLQGNLFGGDPVGELPKDAPFLRIDIDHQLLQFLAEGLHGGRLHKDGGAFAGGVDDPAGEMGLEPFLYGKDKDSAAPGNVGVRQLVFMVKDDLVQFVPDPLLHKRLPAAEIPQGRRRVVQHGVLPDGAADVLLQGIQYRQLRMPGSNGGVVPGRALQIAAHAADGCAEARGGTKLRGRKNAALQRRSKACFDPVRFRQRRGPRVFHHAAGGGGLFCPGVAKVFVKDGFRAAQDPARGPGDGHILQSFDDPVKTE